MVKTRYNYIFGTVRIIGRDVNQVENEVQRLECLGYETYKSYHSLWRGKLVVCMRQSEGQLEKRCKR